MLMQSEREQVAKYGKMMLHRGFTRNTGGYVTALDRENGYFAMTPSGTPYDEIEAKDVCVFDLSGNRIEGEGRLSTEWLVAKKIFETRPDIDAVVHTHSLFATVMGALRMEVPAACFTTSRACGNVRCTDFYNYTTQELADAVCEKLDGRMAVIMGNHGLVACGSNLAQAWITAEEVEFGCEVYWRALCVGKPVCLTEDELKEQIAAGARYHMNAK